MKESCSLLSVYIGFKSNLKQSINNQHYSTFICDNSVTQPLDIANNSFGDFSIRNFSFVDYGQIDSGLIQNEKSIGSICMIDHISHWENLTREEYKKKKIVVAKILFERLETVLPGIIQEIQYYEVSTSKTIQRFTLNYKGTPYGYAQDVLQSGFCRIPIQSFIPNLYFASAWTYPGHGFTSAILSGWFCANDILKIKTLGTKNKLYSVEKVISLEKDKVLKP